MNSISTCLPYLCGLIMADGSIGYYKDEPSSFTIELRDKQILNDIANIYGLEVHSRERYEERYGPTHYYIVYSIRIVKRDIVFHSINKALDKGHKNFTRYYFSLNTYQKNDFIRGYFDGNGYISNPPAFDIQIAHNSKFDAPHIILNHWMNKNNITYVINKDKRCNGDYHRITGVPKGCKFCSLIYNHTYTSLKLTRKYNQYIMQRYKAMNDMRSLRHSVILTIDGKDYIFKGTVEAGNYIGLNYRRVSDIINGKIIKNFENIKARRECIE